MQDVLVRLLGRRKGGSREAEREVSSRITGSFRGVDVSFYGLRREKAWGSTRQLEDPTPYDTPKPSACNFKSPKSVYSHPEPSALAECLNPPPSPTEAAHTWEVPTFSESLDERCPAVASLARRAHRD